MMCGYCEKQEFIVSETETNARGVETTVGVSIVGSILNVERRKASRKGCMIGYTQLAHGRIAYCPMCGEKLRGA